MQQQTKAVRISLDLYNKLVESSKKNETFADILDNIFAKNKLLGIVTQEED
jgi:predicted CopG family antitoxin